ncbi:ankyrin repeat domain-containing protein [Rickettsia honei]|nr:ankyrin repeat domain-containing protein [Rickettsia honei]
MKLKNRTPFSIAASAGNANIVQKLIEQGHNVNAKDSKEIRHYFMQALKK